MGLELRRPRTRITVAATMDQGQRDYHFFQGEGLHWINGGSGVAIPVWGWNMDYQQFSLEWQRNLGLGEGSFIMTKLYDADLPLTMKMANHPPETRYHTAREWEQWPVMDSAQGEVFLLSLSNVPLIQGDLGYWLAPPPQVELSRTSWPDLEHCL